jgi:hypothetical protein
MRFALIVAVLVVAALAAMWLSAGRQIVSLADDLAMVRVAALPAGPFVYSPSTLNVGDQMLETTAPGATTSDISLDIDASRRVFLRSGDQTFPLGRRTDTPDNSGRPTILFVPEAGDDVTFGVTRSVLAWPTPFDFNFMTGRAPSWRRYVYYTLTWRKQNGDTLDLVWRYEQWFYNGDGWQSPTMTQVGATGLVRVSIARR